MRRTTSRVERLNAASIRLAIRRRTRFCSSDRHQTEDDSSRVLPGLALLPQPPQSLHPR